MFFEKPKVRYVDMCIYIDDHIYTDDYSAELVYQYLYHIITMIAIKRDYFRARHDIEDFSLYASSWYFMRLTDERQFGDNPTLDTVKSILNYVKRTLFTLKRLYCKKHFREQELSDVDFVNIDTDAFAFYVNKKVDSLGKVDFGCYLGSIKDTIRNYLKTKS